MRAGRRLTAQGHHQRLEDIAKAFSGRYGQVEYGAAKSPSGATVKLEVRVRIPGWDLPQRAMLVFVEKHLWDGDAWERYAYLYDLHLEPRPSGRFAYHWHDGIPHRHCEDPRAPRDDHHYEGAFFDDILWAADQLFRVAATGIQCHGLRPLGGVLQEYGEAAIAEWVGLFAQAARSAATHAVTLALDLARLEQRWRKTANVRRRGSALDPAHHAAGRRPGDRHPERGAAARGRIRDRSTRGGTPRRGRSARERERPQARPYLRGP